MSRLFTVAATMRSDQRTLGIAADKVMRRWRRAGGLRRNVRRGRATGSTGTRASATRLQSLAGLFQLL